MHRSYSLVQQVNDRSFRGLHYCASLELGNGYPRLRTYGYSAFDMTVDMVLKHDDPNHFSTVALRSEQKVAKILQRWRMMTRYPYSEFRIEKNVYDTEEQ